MNMLTIIDLHGDKIEVIDLKLAMMQADDFRHYTTIDPERKAFFQKQRAYWEDIYQKLLLLQTEI